MKMFFLIKLKEKQVPFDFASFDWTLWPWLHLSSGRWIPLGQVHFMFQLRHWTHLAKIISCFILALDFV